MYSQLKRSLRRRKYKRIIEASGLFDREWYKDRYGLSDGTDPIDHYLANSHRPGLLPFPEFPVNSIAELQQHEVEAGKNQLVRYIRAQARAASGHSGAHDSPPDGPARAETSAIEWQMESFIRDHASASWQDDFANWETVRMQVREALADPNALLKGKEQARVDVILPVHNQFHFSLRCVWSILRALDETPMRLIVSDNVSDDETQEFFGDLPGLTYIRNETNLNFIGSCNNAAGVGTSEFVFLLNNDTAVHDNWLSTLVDAMDRDPGIGLAGSALYYPDGRLQEAGGVIFRDGSSANIGRNSQSRIPLAQATRDVDYVSGAAILVRRALWDKLGGFSREYMPIYCEDSDLALALRQHGYRVVVVPASRVVHYEGQTSGTDTSKGLKAHQVENVRKLRKKWRYTLEAHPKPEGLGTKVLRRARRPRLLVIDHKIPKPNEDAGSVTAVWTMRLLVELGYDVTFVPWDLRPDPENEALLSKFGVEVHDGQTITSIRDFVRSHIEQFDGFLLYRPNTGGTLALEIRKLRPDARIIYFTVDLHFVRMQREFETRAEISESIWDILRMKQLELQLIHLCDATVVLSETEVRLLKKYNLGPKLHQIPLILENETNVPAWQGREGVCFVGGYDHRPNREAVKWFVQEVWPHVQKRAPGTKFYIVGSNPPPDFQELASDMVSVVGFVEDLEGFLEKRLATVATLTYGAGIKGKIGTSMACGVPCVCNSVAVEGMAIEHEREVLVSDTPEGIADCILRLSRDRETWERLSDAGQHFVREHYAPASIRAKLLTLMARARVAPFSGACPVSGDPEDRRFDGSLDFLQAAPGASRSSDRVLLEALRNQLNMPRKPLVDWPRKPGPTKQDVGLLSRAAFVEAALEAAGILGTPGSARFLLGTIDLDGPYEDVWTNLTRAVEENPHLKSVALAVFDSGLRHPGDHADYGRVFELVARLEGLGLLVRTDRTPMAESALTGTILIEAMPAADTQPVS